jgi:hypothetical protein
MESPVNTTVGGKLKVAPHPEVQSRINNGRNPKPPATGFCRLRIFARFLMSNVTLIFCSGQLQNPHGILPAIPLSASFSHLV